MYQEKFQKMQKELTNNNEMNRVFAIIFLLSASCSRELEQKYYPNGNLKFEVPLVDGRRNGKMTVYNEDGVVSETSFWKDGYEEGEVIIYYSNGSIMQKQKYHRGIIVGEVDLYSQNGILTERHYFDSLGRLIDYKEFKANGRQNMDENTRHAIFIEVQDTVRIGEFYESLITLGNRRFDNIEVVLGDPRDSNIIKHPKLPKKDNKHSILRIRADSVGLHHIEGAIIEFNPARKDSLLIIPFRHNFFVK